jgi:hypothetical protein
MSRPLARVRRRSSAFVTGTTALCCLTTSHTSNVNLASLQTAVACDPLAVPTAVDAGVAGRSLRLPSQPNSACSFARTKS